jgi:phospholipase/lecithinase/hemolysin
MAWMAGALVLAMVPGPASAIASLYVFGDSLADSGNAFALTGFFPPPPYDQRFSNGPVAVDRMAEGLGLTLLPSTVGGTNYAVGGAMTGPLAVQGLHTPVATTYDNYLAYRPDLSSPPLDLSLDLFLANTGMDKQVGAFVGSGPSFDPATAQFVVWGGPNDLFVPLDAELVGDGVEVGGFFLPGVSALPGVAANAVANLAGEVLALAGAGAYHILVPNLPDLGATPFGYSLAALDPTLPGQLTALTMAFNLGLEQALVDLQGLLGIDIRYFDTFGALAEVAADPEAFGFTNVTDACLSAGLACGDPDQYLFWDTVHPTARGHALLGDLFVGAVPEPATLWLLAIGAVAIAGRRKVRECLVG